MVMQLQLVAMQMLPDLDSFQSLSILTIPVVFLHQIVNHLHIVTREHVIILVRKVISVVVFIAITNSTLPILWMQNTF
jgi:hypothetical protein